MRTKRQTNRIITFLTQNGLAKVGLSTLFLITVLIGCDSNDNLGQFPLDKDAPAAPTEPNVENTHGGAIIKYKVPTNGDLLYVQATYEINGVKKITKSSVYKNSLEVEGFGDTKEYSVELRSVDRSKNLSEPLVVKINPLTPPTHLIYETMKMETSFGGVRLTWKNEAKKNVVISFMAADSTGTLVDAENVYTSIKDGSFTLRGFDATEREFAVYVRDRWDNYSDTLKGAFTPWFEEELDKEKFKAVFLPNDAEKTGHLLSRVWDDIISEGKGFWHTNQEELPIKCTIDLGQKVKLSRYKIWQRPGAFYYTHNNPKVWEIYGSNEPGATGELDDGTWTKLVADESFKPSGDGPVTNEDKEYADRGEEFEFPLDAPEVRYLRFVMYENWSGGNIAQMGEMSFWGQIVE
ncbi:DUF4959 domain-containing protein [Prolixibacteraceae bacterium JC049]|nr:DUF4959 domain-containing protein [Prolixibacteraceae bacterium JC049]